MSTQQALEVLAKHLVGGLPMTPLRHVLALVLQESVDVVPQINFDYVWYHNSNEETAVCDRFFENTINRCQRLTFDNEATAEASFVAIGSSSDGCRVNRDCPSNHICQFRGREARGTCVRRNASSSSDDTQTCRRNNDCPDPDTQRCNDAGYCVIRNRMVPRSGDTCERNGDCGANRICGDNGHCQRRDMEFAMEQY